MYSKDSSIASGYSKFFQDSTLTQEAQTVDVKTVEVKTQDVKTMEPTKQKPPKPQ